MIYRIVEIIMNIILVLILLMGLSIAVKFWIVIMWRKP